jgi:hypothetical protein
MALPLGIRPCTLRAPAVTGTNGPHRVVPLASNTPNRTVVLALAGRWNKTVVDAGSRDSPKNHERV